MKVLEQSEQRLVIGGWNIKALVWGVAYVALAVGMYLLVVLPQPEMIFFGLFVAAICGGLLLSAHYRARIDFDRLKGEARFDQRHLLGWKTRIRPPVSRLRSLGKPKPAKPRPGAWCLSPMASGRRFPRV